MHFLEKIIAAKKREVAGRMESIPQTALERAPYFATGTSSLVAHLSDPGPGRVIAEFKRRSPSRGELMEGRTVREVTTGYVRAGAVGLSVLTDTEFFGGSLADLQEARRYNLSPLLRKDFIIHEYQLFEAKATGADVVLLIAECLSAAEVRQLAARARSLGLEVLLEMHSATQLPKICDEVDIVGINNRDLHRFETDLRTSFELIEAIPKSTFCISESGISRPEEARQLRAAGFRGFLMGTHFVTAADPVAACGDFIQQLEGISLQRKTRTA